MSHSGPAPTLTLVDSGETSDSGLEAGDAGASTCRNCGALHVRHFCAECGQRVQRDPLSMPALFRRLLEDLVDLDKGVLHTAWQLTRRPAMAVREYLDGRQAPYTNPLRYLVVVAAITTLGFHAADVMDRYVGDPASVPVDAPAAMQRYAEILNHLMSRYFNLLSIAAAPFVAIGSYLLFRPARRTFAEHLVFNAYTYAHAGLLVAGLMITIRLAGGPEPLIHGTMIFWFVYWIWAAVDFFGLGRWSGFVRGLVAGLLGTILYNVVLLGGLLVFVKLTTG